MDPQEFNDLFGHDPNKARQEIPRLEKDYERQFEENKELREENRRLREALNFYAQGEHYEKEVKNDRSTCWTDYTIIKEVENGRKARKALEGDPTSSEPE